MDEKMTGYLSFRFVGFTERLVNRARSVAAENFRAFEFLRRPTSSSHLLSHLKVSCKSCSFLLAIKIKIASAYP